MTTGRSASPSSASARSIASPSGCSARGAWTSGASSASASMNTTSSGKSRNTGPLYGRPRDRERLVDQPRDLRRRARGGRELDDRPHERHVVDLLQRALPPAERGRAPTEHDHRRVVLLGARHRAHPVGDAGPRGQRRDARLARDLRPPFGRERGRRLVAGVDDVDAFVLAALVEREQVAAREREQPCDAVGLQASGNEAAAVQPRGFVVHMRAGIYPPGRGVAPPGPMTGRACVISVTAGERRAHPQLQRRRPRAAARRGGP